MLEEFVGWHTGIQGWLAWKVPVPACLASTVSVRGGLLPCLSLPQAEGVLMGSSAKVCAAVEAGMQKQKQQQLFLGLPFPVCVWGSPREVRKQRHASLISSPTPLPRVGGV